MWFKRFYFQCGMVATDSPLTPDHAPPPGGPQDDHGYISREFHRRYRLPSNVDQSALSCSLSADGMLTFSGPKVQSGLDAGHSERAIPVSREEKPSSAPSS